MRKTLLLQEITDFGRLHFLFSQFRPLQNDIYFEKLSHYFFKVFHTHEKCLIYYSISDIDGFVIQLHGRGLTYAQVP